MWAAGDRVLVCVGPDTAATGRAPRQTGGRPSRRPGQRSTSKSRDVLRQRRAERDRIVPRHCGWPSYWAARPGGIPGQDVAERIVAIRARATTSRTSWSGQSRRTGARRWRQGSVVDSVSDRCAAGDQLSMSITDGVQRARPHQMARTGARLEFAAPAVSPRALPAASPLSLCSLAGRPAAAPGAGIANVALIFLTAVLVSAVRLRLVARAVRQLRRRAGLQFLLPAAALHLHDRRSRKTSSRCSSSRSSR